MSFGDRFNSLIDNIVSASWRMLDLPLFVILLFLLVVFFLIFQLGLKSSKTKIVATVLLFLFSFSLISDYKISKALKEIRENREPGNSRGLPSEEDAISEEQIRATQKDIQDNPEWNQHIIDQASELGISYEENLRNNAVFVLEGEQAKARRNEKILGATHYSVKEKLVQMLGEIEFVHESLAKGIDYYELGISEPRAMAYICRIDLEAPNINIEITSEKKEKYLTSTFAKEHECIVAINGEAGNSAQAGAPMGPWIGNWISKGNIVLMEDGSERPFLSFNKKNRALYFREEVVDTQYNDDKYNTIYGRFDVLVDGETIMQERYFRQPRTLMGINRKGNVLYLMVVDGRRPAHSIGMGLYRAGNILNAFGAYHAMSCDQGGSSCMYLAGRGIVNIPADDGRERPTYSHFGISINP